MIQLKYPPPSEFLKAETRDGFYVSAKIKELWSVELDLAQELLRVCKKNNLKIFADCGTLLGAVRHKGFIPWDDDMDFSMLRADYEKLCRIAPEEFKFPYYLQYSNTGKGFINGHAKLRNSKTTGIVKDEMGRNLLYNQGIFIDIFPLDNVSDNRFFCSLQMHLAQIFRILMLIFAFFSSRYYESSNPFLKYPKKVFHLIVNKPFEWFQEASYKMMLRISLKCAGKITKYVSGLTFADGLRKLLKNNYENETFVEFEFLKIPIMQNFESILTSWYGDWRIPHKGGAAHGELLFDTDLPYQEYKNRKD